MPDTTTDRELMKLAAKALGTSFRIDGVSSDGRSAWLENGPFWQPFDSDGHAFRLAVMLGLSPEVHYDASQPLPWLRVAHRQPGGNERWTHVSPEEYAADPFAATRRAIVRAAAQVQREREAG